MANDIYNYSVMTNTGKGFITLEDSRAFWISGQPANVWIATDCRESRHWVARNRGVSKTKDQAQTLVTAAVDADQDAWDDDNVEGESSAEKIIRIGPKPADITIPQEINMANDKGFFNYWVVANSGKGFITHTDSRKFWIKGYPANVWVCDDIPESRDWGARNSAASKTKSQAQTLVTNQINSNQDTWDNDNVDGESADEKIERLGSKPEDITLP